MLNDQPWNDQPLYSVAPTFRVRIKLNVVISEYCFCINFMIIKRELECNRY